MASSAAFEAACAQLEAEGTLDRLAARGTIRVVLKEAGLEPGAVTADELAVVAQKLLPAELAARGVPEPEALCAAIARGLADVESAAGEETPESVFARLAAS